MTPPPLLVLVVALAAIATVGSAASAVPKPATHRRQSEQHRHTLEQVLQSF